MIFEACEVSFVKDDESEYRYFIQVENKKKSDNGENEYYLVIEEDMAIQRFMNQNKIGLQWKFQNSYLQLLFKEQDVGLFQELLCNLIYQTSYKKEIDDQTKQSQLDQYCQDIGQVKDSCQMVENRSDEEDDYNYDENYVKVQELMTRKIVEKEVKVAYTGKMYQLVEKRKLVNKNVLYMIVEKQQFLYCQRIVDKEDKVIIETLIDDKLDFNIDYLENGVKFIDYQDGQFRGLMVVFDKEVINDVKTQILKYRFEYQEQDDLETILSKYGEDQIQVEQQLDGGLMNCIEEVEEYDDFQVHNLSATQNQKQIKQILYNQNSNRTFVNDDNVIQVYGIKDYQFEEIGELPRLKVKDQDLDCKDMLLFSDNQKFLLTDNEQNLHFYEYDINRQQITSQIQANQGIQIDRLAYSQKNQNQTANQVIYGINNQNIYQLDLRMKNQKTLANSKCYKTDPKFNSICATMDGKFAVGSDEGVVRLYRGLGDNSLNNFYTLSRNRITMIDCTKDGKYMIVTTDKELFLFDCTFQNKNGFENRLQSAKGERQSPIVLKLLVNDIQKYQIKDIKFRKAKFDESVQNEKYIVASINQFIITWSIKNVVNGQPQKYKIYRTKNDQTVVDNMFKSGDQQIQLYATRSTVSMEKLNQIKQRLTNR